MKAISLHQPWATLLVTRQPLNVADRVGGQTWPQPMVKRIETRSWPCPPAVIGERLAFHATQTEPWHALSQGDHIGKWRVKEDDDGFYGYPIDADAVPVTRLPLGAIVGSGVVTASLPIYPAPTGPDEPDHPWVGFLGPSSRILACWQVDKHFPPLLSWRDVSDQLPYGDFTPGRFAWIIEDAAPTTERCPWCWGEGRPFAHRYEHEPCPVCRNHDGCDPIPARGRQRIWNWKAELEE